MPLDNTSPPDDNPFHEHNSRASKIMFPVAERAVGWQTKAGGYQKITSHKSIIRMTPTGESVHVLAVVGATYKLIHNKELFGHVEDTMCKEMHVDQLRGVQIKDKVAGYGRMCFREYVFPNIKCSIGGGARSDIAFRLLVQNGYGGSALRFHGGAIEAWCSNGMIWGAHDSTYNKHTSGLVIQGIGSALVRSLDSFVSQQDRWRKWATKPVQHKDAMELFHKLALSEKLTEKLTDQYLHERDQRGDNLWAVYSTLTYYASHSDGDFKMRKTVEEMDTAASTMLRRELEVAQWIRSDAWKQMEDA